MCGQPHERFVVMFTSFDSEAACNQGASAILKNSQYISFLLLLGLIAINLGA